MRLTMARGVPRAKRLIRSMLTTGLPALFAATTTLAQQAGGGNTISDLVSVPFQFNWYQNVGPLELSTFILNYSR